jgi:hypothetical protein
MGTALMSDVHPRRSGPGRSLAIARASAARGARALEPIEDVFGRPEESLLCVADLRVACRRQVRTKQLERAPEMAVLGVAGTSPAALR